MCGIAGFIDPVGQLGGDGLGAVVTEMANSLTHRGPDDSGIWVDKERGVALGHRRLAVLDLTQHGHQPMGSADGRYRIVYNGEVYNYQYLKEQLGRAGYECHGNSDTEVVLGAICTWGLTRALKSFVGMFAFALWDRKEQVLHLVRDRLGEKPLYYGWAGKIFLFASEVKALQRHPAWRGVIDRDALALYMRHSYIPAPYSIYKSIYKLPAGCVLTIKNNNASTMDGFSPTPNGTTSSKLYPTPFWSLKSEIEKRPISEPPLDGREAIDRFDALLRSTVKEKMIADVPLGALLSGGIDSSLVVAAMQSVSEKPIKTYTIGFHEERYDEARYAREVAEHLGTDHTELYVTAAQALEVIPKLATIYDEPFADASQIPTYLVSSLARQQVTVALSGDGGDELFGGYDRYRIGATIWNRVGWIPGSIKRYGVRGLQVMPGKLKQGIVGLLRPFMPKAFELELTTDKLDRLMEIVAADTPERMYRELVSHWKDPEGLVPGSKEPSTVFEDSGAWPELSDFLEKMMYLDTMSYLPDDILTKVDRASMAVSLEVRIPLLDHRVVEFSWRLRVTEKMRGDQSKWLMRQVLYKYVPKRLIERPKMGFAVPLDSWLRGPLRDWAEDLLNMERIASDGFLDPVPIKKKWTEHVSGQYNWQYYLWDVLMFQAWREQIR